MTIAGVMTKFRIDEVSGVTKGAQEGAKAVFMKRDFTADERQAAADSGAALPDGSFPIKTTGDLKNAIRAFGRAKDKAAAKRHIIERAKALGATDELPDGWTVSKAGDPGPTAEEGDAMSAAIKKALGLADTATDAEVEAAVAKAAKANTDLATSQAALETALAKAGMTDAEKVFCKSMDDATIKAFMAKSANDRAAEIEKARAGDETLTVDGNTIRKSEVGAGVFAVMKAQQAKIDTQAADFAKAQETTANASFTKAATDDYSNLAGSVDERVLVLKHLAKADEPTRKAGEAILKAAQAVSKLAFEKLGVKDGGKMMTGANDGDADCPTDKAGALKKLDELANARVAKVREAGGKITFAKAYEEVSMENKPLYNVASGIAKDGANGSNDT